MKINSIEEGIKTKGIQYGRPIVKLDINEKEGIEINVDKLISLINRNSDRYNYILITGNPMFYKKELIELTHRLLPLIEIETDGIVSPKGISDLTNVNFCVIMDSDTRKDFEETLRQYKVLSEYGRAYYLFNVENKRDLDKIQEKQEKFNLYPIYISLINDIKDKDFLIKTANNRGWFVTPLLDWKD